VQGTSRPIMFGRRAMHTLNMNTFRSVIMHLIHNLSSYGSFRHCTLSDQRGVLGPRERAYPINYQSLSGDISTSVACEEHSRSHEVFRDSPSTSGYTIKSILGECWVLTSSCVAGKIRLPPSLRPTCRWLCFLVQSHLPGCCACSTRWTVPS
jgi:hypothetical protein